MNEEHGGGSAALNAAEQKRREKARKLRWKHAVARDINWQKITDELYEMQEACDEIRYFVDGDDGMDNLVAAMDNDEDEAYEFRMTFSSLVSDIERLQEILGEGWETLIEEDDFNDLFAALRASMDGSDALQGYDMYEQDFFSLDFNESDAGMQESRKRLMRFTKAELIDLAQRCFNLAIQFVGLRARYDDLKTAIDLLRGQNVTYLQQIKEIEVEYEKEVANPYRNDWSQSQFDKLVNGLPERVWLE